MAMEHIVEETFCVKENVALAVKLMPLVPEEDIQNDKVNVHVVYPVRNPQNSIFVYGFEGPRTDIVRNFKKELDIYIKEYKPQRLIDYAFFVATYCPVSSTPSIYTFKEDIAEFTKDREVDDILMDTHGFLLFDYQLEQLISIFQRSEHAAVRTRQALNKRDSLAENRARRMLFNSGWSLLDVFNERLKMSFTVFPSMSSAKTLKETVEI